MSSLQSYGNASQRSQLTRLSQFFLDAGELGFDLLVDAAEAGLDDAAAGGDRRVGDDVGRSELAERFGELLGVVAEQFVVGRIQVERHVGGAGGQAERFADPLERDFGLLAGLRGG